MAEQTPIDTTDADKLHLMMDYATGIDHKTVDDWEFYLCDRLGYARHGDTILTGMVGDVSALYGDMYRAQRDQKDND